MTALPSELTRCSDALVIAVADLLPSGRDVSVFRNALSDLLAATLGGATSMAAGAVVALDGKIERLTLRVHELEARQVGDVNG